MSHPASRIPRPPLTAYRLPLTALAVLLATTAWFYRHGDSGNAPIYRTATIERGSVKPTVSSTGTLSAVKTIQVGTQVSGQVSAIYADFNQHVRRGQLLATIDPALQNQAVEEAQAQLDRAQATMEQVQGDYARSKQLYEWKAITASEFSAVQSNFSVHKADLRSAQIALDRARQNLAYTRIYAPIDGVIVERNVDVGQTVAANFSTPQLFLIANDLADMQILALVDESDIGAIRTGQPVQFTVQAYPNDVFQGTVQQVRLQSKTQDNVVNYTAVVGVHNATGKLLPGMTATVQFLTGTANDVLIVPNSALRIKPTPAMMAQSQTPVLISDAQDPSSPLLWTLDAAGKLNPVHVHAGLSDDIHTEVSGQNLKPGTRIVIGVADPHSLDDAGSNNPFQNPRPSGGDKGG